MPKRRRAALLPNNIALLQNLVRRDPGSYKEEFLVQYRHYATQKEILVTNPSGFHDTDAFLDQIGFIAQVCTCYPSDTKAFPEDLAELLSKHHTVLPVELREKIVQSLMLLRNRGVITSERLIQIIFPLLTTTNSKTFRKDIYTTLVRLLKHANRNAKAPKLNRSVQTLLFTLLESSDGVAAAPDGLWAAKLTRELWRRSIWDDPRTAEIMKQAALHGNTKVVIAGVSFFLGVDREREKATRKKRGLDDDDDSSDDSASSDDGEGGKPQIAGIKHRMGINKKSGKRARKLEAAMRALKKKEKGAGLPTQLNFAAIHLLHDPQGFADRLFSQTLSRSSGNKFTLEQRIQILNLVSRLIGVHKLSVLGFYSYLLKYLTPKQRNVTQFMAAAAQSSHDLVPPDALSPVIRKIADEFVSDGVAAEVAAAGLNTIREILTRNPLAIEADLLQDLTEYKGSKSKSVMMAARSLIGLYRGVAPEMLARKDRGKIASMEMNAAAAAGQAKKLQYGVENVVEGIPGLELLERWRKEQGLDNDDEDAAAKEAKDDDDAWNIDMSDSEESDNGWIDVESDKEYDVSDDGAGRPEDDESDEDDDSDDSDKEPDAEEQLPDAKRAKTENVVQNLMATKILAPADFQKLDELRTKAGLDKILHGGQSAAAGRHQDSVDAISLLGSKTGKADKEERMAAVMEGRQDRQFGSKKGKKDSQPHSTTNKEKARKKNFIMMIHKRDVQGKNKKSLRDKQKSLRAHIDKQKKSKRKH
ncbi:SDA1-domain-containing protein [Lipomyces orientalis]|uniref:SDA1-domain-containing protein n=1 Tax=Lipomyces orientalis TaxID=1233043 RepID=A0ACC3TPB2_9ASCO